jgi:hypothetical protein
VVAQRSVIHHRREATEGAQPAQFVHPALDCRCRQRHVLGDVVVGAAPVLDEQRKNLTISGVHTLIYCRDYIDIGIDNV